MSLNWKLSNCSGCWKKKKADKKFKNLFISCLWARSKELLYQDEVTILKVSLARTHSRSKQLTMKEKMAQCMWQCDIKDYIRYSLSQEWPYALSIWCLFQVSDKWVKGFRYALKDSSFITCIRFVYK